jgi:hypothetical protein
MIKNGKLYVATPMPEKMPKSIWIVYTINDGSLESSHLEDMETGKVLYENKSSKVVLVKE